jgi:ketosteroid isomerase-like protein
MPYSEIHAVEAFIGAINRRSPTEIADLMTEDHTFVDSAGRVASGREQMTAGWGEFFRMFPDYSMVVESILAENGNVAVFGSVSGTYNGTRGPVPENRIEMPAAWRAAVQHGKVKRWQVYADWTEGVRIIAADAERGTHRAAADGAAERR